jgi:CRP-like cAMP-binding protein
VKPKHVPQFDAFALLKSAAGGGRVVQFRTRALVYSQGDRANSVMYVQKGAVKLSVVSRAGKEAVVAMLGPGDFLGEGCLVGQTIRMGTATAVMPSSILIVSKRRMLRLLQDRPEMSELFIAYVLAKNIRAEENLIDQLFNSSEKRLARMLVLLAHYGKLEKPQRVLPKVSQETLAEMIGTTRSRVNFFMNKFRKLGLIEYNGELKINSSLLSVVLHD